jgi:hypothetical protein
MDISAYEDINVLIAELTSDIKSVLGDKLIGLYVYGSLIWGDFDHHISDVDMLAALETDVSDTELADLKAMHDQFVSKHPEWDDRIEVQYFSKAGLQNFKTQARRMANISPGEPLHLIEAGREWFMNWYFVLTYGKIVFGPPPSTLIPYLTKEEFIAATIDHAKDWKDYVRHTQNSRPYQGYAVMTLCRALYTVTHGEQVSKKQAAEWVASKFPQYADLIWRSFIWRDSGKDEAVDPSLTYPEVKQFVEFMSEKITSETPGRG